MENTNTNKPLTDKQKIFCEEYIIDLNGTQAAIRAGYEENWAKTTSCHLMEIPAVRQYIRQLLNKRSRKLEITAEAVLQELASIAFASAEDFNIETADGEEPSMVKKTSCQANCKITQEDKTTGRRIVYQFNVRDKIRALVALGKHLGIFEKDINDFLRSAKFIFPPVALR